MNLKQIETEALHLTEEERAELAQKLHYHCISRCVRRAWLCGDDPLTKKNYDYRKPWFIDRMKTLSAVFAIDICAYTIMSNHYHLVLQVDKQRVSEWTDREVLKRWATIFTKTDAAKILEDEEANKYLVDYVFSQIPKYREQLSSISWFMRCLNEHIAREANKDDGCKGRFWEGRFKSQALLDEAALLACMAYVDLNPIRAGAAKNLEQSDYTSIKERMDKEKSQKKSAKKQHNQTEETEKAELLSFTRQIKRSGLSAKENKQDLKTNRPAIPYEYKDYLELVTWTGKVIRTDKKGYLSNAGEMLLTIRGIQKENWLDTVKHFGKRFYHVVGKVHTINLCDREDGKVEVAWLRGKSGAKRFYGEAA